MAGPRKKSDRLSWFKMDAGAFLADTTGLPAAHVGVYARLMALYWTSGNKLPEDEAILKRKLAVSSPEDCAALAEVLAEFFPDGSNDGLDNQLDEVKADSEQKARNAKGSSKAPAQPSRPVQPDIPEEIEF